jgi:hypothetical protein
MLTGSGMHTVWHHSRAHRLFAATRWSLDQVGLVVLSVVIGWLVPAGKPVAVAVDDTLFRRRGRKVHAAHWAYDCSRQVAAGQQKLSRGKHVRRGSGRGRVAVPRPTIALPVLAGCGVPLGRPRTRWPGS